MEPITALLGSGGGKAILGTLIVTLLGFLIRKGSAGQYSTKMKAIGAAAGKAAKVFFVDNLGAIGNALAGCIIAWVFPIIDGFQETFANVTVERKSKGSTGNEKVDAKREAVVAKPAADPADKPGKDMNII